MVRAAGSRGWCCVVPFLLLASAAVRGASDLSDGAQVTAVQGVTARLPCEVTPALPNDKVHTVIWFKENANGTLTSIYSFDSRDNVLAQGKHWADQQVLGERAHLRFHDKPARLIISNVLSTDAGMYQCRVDFGRSPTRIIKLSLIVIIPPQKLEVLDENARKVTDHVLGPYREGSSFNITCVSSGGSPIPRVTWWQENALLDDSYSIRSQNMVENTLHVHRLERKHLNKLLTCQSSNNDVVAPVSISLTLDLNLRPLSARLVGENRPLSAGRAHQFECQVVGARPSPRIIWRKGGTVMKNAKQVESSDGNITMSTLNFTPSLDDEGKYIFCTAEQPLIPGSAVESGGWKLNIRHTPVLNLELVSNSNRDIREGDDVHFVCNVKSNPWIYKISWKRNGKMIFSNASKGIIITNQSLILHNIDKDQSGFYSCVGSNQEGDGISNAVRLEVNFAPVCFSKNSVTYHVRLHETIRITCELEANPPNVEYIWKFNDTEISSHLISVKQTISTVAYTPNTIDDYGTLYCSGINAVGEQKEPCVFHITAGDKPDPLSNCSLLNQTHRSLLVKCALRVDGGSNQTFVAEVYDVISHEMLKNLSSTVPTFAISKLNLSSPLLIKLYAISEYGKGQIFHLNASFPSSPIQDELLPPENCSVTHRSRHSIRIKCQVPPYNKSVKYLLQVYDANSHTLVGTNISRSPEAIEVTTLPRGSQDLHLFIRTVADNSTRSEAIMLSLLTSAKSSNVARHVSAPVKFTITPTLAITISVAIGVLFIIITIIVACRFCKSSKSKNKQRKSEEYSVSSHYSDYSKESPGEIANDNPDIIPLKNQEEDESPSANSRNSTPQQNNEKSHTSSLKNPYIQQIAALPHYGRQPSTPELSNDYQPMFLHNSRLCPFAPHHPHDTIYVHGPPSRVLPSRMEFAKRDNIGVAQPLLENHGRAHVYQFQATQL